MLSRLLRTSILEILILAIPAAGMFALAGCKSHPSATDQSASQSAQSETAPGETGDQTSRFEQPSSSSLSSAGLFGVDCGMQLAYVPLLDSPDPKTCNGRVAVIDLSVDPNTTDARKTTIVLNHPDSPTGTAIDTAHHLVVIVSGSGGTGFVDVVDETSNKLVSGSPFKMPNVQPGDTGQVMFDPANNVAIIGVEQAGDCPDKGGCTGFITFDPVAHTFGQIIAGGYPKNFGFNSATQQILDNSEDDDSGEIGVIDITSARACTLADSNLGDGGIGASFDITTNVGVIGGEEGTATLINLNGSKVIAGSNSDAGCTIQESGTEPNSVQVQGLPDDTAASAVNSVTHTAFMVAADAAGIALLDLPSAPVEQMAAVKGPAIGNIPNDPLGAEWSNQSDPYLVAMDQCHNFGFAVENASSGKFGAAFLARVDLQAFKSDPQMIGTVLPSGKCAGVTTAHSCKNNHGVVFYPLPPASETASCASAVQTPRATPTGRK
jgi:hypothetical protein